MIGELAERDARVRGLEAQLIELNQNRQDVAKRLDDLIEQVDQLDAQLDTQPGGGLDLPEPDGDVPAATPGAGS